MSVSSRNGVYMFALLILVCFGVHPSKGENDLMMYALPVGQGDCTVFVCPKVGNEDGKVIIVDMGSTRKFWTEEDVKNFLSMTHINGKGSLYSRVSTIILTHGDTDHTSYFRRVFPDKPAVLKHLLLGGKKEDYRTAIPEKSWGAKEMNFFLGIDQCKRKVCNGIAKLNEKLCGDGTEPSFTVLDATVKDPTKNEASVVLRIESAGTSALLVGDLEGKAMQKLIEADEKDAPLSSTYFKMAHHGALADNSKAFIDRVKPRFAFGSSFWADKGHHHPKCAVIRALERHTDTAAEHTLNCWGDGGLERKPQKKAIWSTMPGPTDEDGYVISLRFGGKVTPHKVPKSPTFHHLEEVVQKSFL